MAISKVIDRNGNTLIDLSNDDVTPQNVLEGYTFHGRDGEIYTGTLRRNETEQKKFLFIDHYDNLLFQYTYDELQALNELPTPPDYSSDNLQFIQWNWDLEALKGVKEDEVCYPTVCAEFETVDHKTYIKINFENTSYTNFFLRLGRISREIGGGDVNNFPAETLNVDWGDGTSSEYQFNIGSVSVEKSHQYDLTNNKEFIITINEPEENSRIFIKSSDLYEDYNALHLHHQNNNFLEIKTFLLSDIIFQKQNLKSIPSWFNTTDRYTDRFYTFLKVPKNIDSIGVYLFTHYTNYSKPFYCSFPDTSFKITDYSDINYKPIVSSFLRNNIFLNDGVTNFTQDYYLVYELNGRYPDTLNISLNYRNYELFKNDLNFENKNLRFELDSSMYFDYFIETIKNELTINNCIIYNSSNNEHFGHYKINIKNMEFTEGLLWIINKNRRLLHLDISNAGWESPPVLSENILYHPVEDYKLHGGSLIVPLDQLELYKSYPYWSNYADIMVGV